MTALLTAILAKALPVILGYVLTDVATDVTAFAGKSYSAALGYGLQNAS